MVVYCFGCENNSKNKPEMTFFRFPKDEIRCGLWFEVLGKPRLPNYNANYCYMNLKLCLAHFESKDVRKNQLKKRLYIDALPISKLRKYQFKLPYNYVSPIQYVAGEDIESQHHKMETPQKTQSDFVQLTTSISQLPTLRYMKSPTEGNEAKKSWEKLRNNHQGALRRQKVSKPKSGSGAVNIKAWRFQENMAFLISYMANRPSNTNVNEDILNDESSHSNSNTIENDIQKNVNETDIHESGVEETNETPESQSTGTAADQGNKRRQKTNTLNNLLTKSIEDHDRKAAKRQQERERLIANTNNDFAISNVKNDPLFHFFISMYESTKRLPPLSQHNIKTNIFSLVSQEESKNLVEYSPGPHSSYS